MFKGTPEIISQRREEIVGACELLYQTANLPHVQAATLPMKRPGQIMKPRISDMVGRRTAHHGYVCRKL